MKEGFSLRDLHATQDDLARGRWGKANAGMPPGSPARSDGTPLIRCIDVHQSKGGPILRLLATLQCDNSVHPRKVVRFVCTAVNYLRIALLIRSYLVAFAFAFCPSVPSVCYRLLHFMIYGIEQ